MLAKAILIVCCVAVAATKLPRGVPQSRAAFYARAKEFQCLDGSARIPYDQVNDDYCDCPDGSDEPGTSACPNGRFYCENKLHAPEMLLSSRVNDRICDCCDGSDEYDGSVTCPNTCEELGRGAREEKERRSAMKKAGWEKRKALAAEGAKMKEEKEAGIADLRAQKAALEPEQKLLEDAKRITEEKEKALRDEHSNQYAELRKEKKRSAASLLFATIDTDKDGKITVAELTVLNYLDANGDGTVDETEIKMYVGENGEADLDHFIEHSFQVLRQKRRDREFADKHGDGNQEQPPQDSHADEADVEKHGEEDEEVDVEEEPVAPIVPVDEFDDDVPYPAYTDEQNKMFEEANEARKKYGEINNKVVDIDNQIRDADAFSSLDFGEDLAWAPLKGRCIEYEEGQYVYTLCPFDRCSQKEKGGHSDTNLGTWKGWKQQYTEMEFGDGQTCWNGPARSTKVTIECGDEDKVVEATEPGRCEYHFRFLTPAACDDPAKEAQVHQEL